MPDPASCLLAVLAAAGVSALATLGLGWMPRRASPARVNAACALGIAAGLAAGYGVLQIRPAWPPANGLDRFLLIVLPASIALELVAGVANLPRWLVWSSRLALSTVIGPVLWRGSIYATGYGNEWAAQQAGAALAICGGLLAAEWAVLAWLYARSPGISIPLVLSQTTLCAGMLVMLAGYVTGGESALPPAAALAGASLASARLTKHPLAPIMIGIGLVGLFGLLFIGRFFGGLTNDRALVVLLAPLLCCATEARAFRGQKPWRIAALRLGLTAIPLIAVLSLAKRDFDRDTAPLLGRGHASYRLPLAAYRLR